MTEIQFIKINDIFNQYIRLVELDDDYNLIDNESVISRVYKKLNDKIDSGVLGLFLVFNVHIKDEKYEDAQKIKDYILFYNYLS